MKNDPTKNPIFRSPQSGNDSNHDVIDRRIKLVDPKARRRQRIMFFAMGGLVIAIIIAVLLTGWYISFYKPPRITAAEVGETRFTQGDLVKRARVLQSLGSANQFSSITSFLHILYNFDPGSALGPFNLGLVQMELLRQSAAEYGVTVSESDIDRLIQAQFKPPEDQQEEVSPGQLEQEFEENYRAFLTTTRLSDDDYRRHISEQIYFFRMREAITSTTPDEVDHFELSWIPLPITLPEHVLDTTAWHPKIIRERLSEGEDFESLAYEAATEFFESFQYADFYGYVGWIPKGAFKELDGVLFNGEDGYLNDEGIISKDILMGDNIYIVKVMDGPSTMSVSDEKRWLTMVKNTTLETWLNERFLEGTSEGWLSMKYDSEIYSWGLKQLAQTAGD